MTTVAVVFSPDPDLGPDPLDTTAKSERRLGEVIADGSDFVLVWREWGDEFVDGSRTHVLSSGAWEHLTHDQIMAALASLDES